MSFLKSIKTPEQIYTEKLESTYFSKVSENNSAFEQAMASMTTGYPASEVQSWERQRAEALAWEVDSSVATPWIDIASSARGISREEYLERTVNKVHQFANISAYLIGRRQAIDDLIKQATTIEQLESISISYEIPE